MHCTGLKGAHPTGGEEEAMMAKKERGIPKNTTVQGQNLGIALNSLDLWTFRLLETQNI